MFDILVYLGNCEFKKCYITSVGETAALSDIDCEKSADLLDLLTV